MPGHCSVTLLRFMLMNAPGTSVGNRCVLPWGELCDSLGCHPVHLDASEALAKEATICCERLAHHHSAQHLQHMHGTTYHLLFAPHAGGPWSTP